MLTICSVALDVCDHVHATCCDTDLQCDLFTFDEDDFSPEEIAALELRTANMHLLLIDAGYEQAHAPWPPHWHYIPYKTNVHYVPLRRGRDVAHAATLPERGDAWAYNTTIVAPPPSEPPWLPTAVSQHARPILAMYIGFDSRVRDHVAIQKPLWGVKYLVRFALLEASCLQ